MNRPGNPLGPGGPSGPEGPSGPGGPDAKLYNLIAVLMALIFSSRLFILFSILTK